MQSEEIITPFATTSPDMVPQKLFFCRGWETYVPSVYYIKVSSVIPNGVSIIVWGLKLNTIMMLKLRSHPMPRE